MLPLILLALGVGGALIAYEFSPRTRARVDDYARAIREAHAAHVAADAYLGNADRATAIASHHAQEMIAAQQEALATPPPVPVSPPTRPPPTPAPTPAPAPAPLPPAVPPAPVSVQPAPPPSPVAPQAPVLVQPTPPPPTLPPAPAPVSPPPPPAQDRAADHADAAQTAIDAAADHVAIATEQNQVAAQNTADAARAAKTEAERKAAADSAAKVLEREKKIAAALASLGIGQCGVRSFPRVTPQIKNTLLSKLHAEGMAVTGDNPWNIGTQQYDVKLRAVWDPKAQVLKLIVTAGKGGYFGLVTCDEIWKKIDPIMKGVIG